MIVPPSQQSSRLLSLSMASGAGANTRTAAKGKPTAVVPTVRPRRRESPLAAAARRAKEAMERRPTRSKEVMQGVAQRSEVSEKAKVSPSRRPPGSQRNQSKESKEQSTDPKDAQDVKERLERSEGRSEKDRDFTRTVGKFEKHGFTVPSPETSAGSTPKCVLSEDCFGGVLFQSQCCWDGKYAANRTQAPKSLTDPKYWRCVKYVLATLSFRTLALCMSFVLLSGRQHRCCEGRPRTWDRPSDSGWQRLRRPRRKRPSTQKMGFQSPLECCIVQDMMF